MLNACYNCIDRHLPEKENDVALIWEGDEPALEKKSPMANSKGSVPAGERSQGTRCLQGGPRYDLYAYGPRSRLRHAGLRENRRRSLGCVWRVLTGISQKPHP